MTGTATMYEHDEITLEDRLAWASAAYAAGDMIAHVAACWSCERRPRNDNLIPWDMESRFIEMSLGELIGMVELAMVEGRGWAATQEGAA